jgi:hypothetical protein
MASLYLSDAVIGLILRGLLRKIPRACRAGMDFLGARRLAGIQRQFHPHPFSFNDT